MRSETTVEFTQGAHPAAFLLVQTASGTAVHELPREKAVVCGRSRNCELPVVDTTVSRRHAKFVFDGTLVRVDDLGSRNGISKDGALAEHVELRAGETMLVGRVRVTLSIVKPAGSGGARITVARDCAWFEREGSPRVDLSLHRSLVALLAALIERRKEAGLGVSELAAIGWPGERIIPSAAAQRVHTAVHTLRTMGLKGVLQTHRGRYRIAPDVVLAREP